MVEVLSALAFVLTLTVRSAETATVKPNKVNVRGQASLSSEVITQLQKGETVVILEEVAVAKPKRGEPANWLKIELPGNTPVWVYAPYIETTNKTVNVSRLNLRAGPGENFSVLGRVERGTPVKEIRTEKNWMEVEAPAGTYAFIAAEYVERTAPTPAPVPVATEPATATAPAAATTPQPALPTPIVVAVQPEPPPTPAVEPIPTTPATAAPPTNAVVPPPETSPTAPEPTPTVEVTPKRTVTREGRVVVSMSIQAPTEYALASLETRWFINYLHTEQIGIKLKSFAGRRVIVSGEELIDVRWTNTPIMEVESINIVP